MADVDSFLRNIAYIESGNGKNTNHPIMQSGMHKGMRAIGRYGIMPLTAQEIAGSSSDPEVRQLLNVSPHEVHDIVASNPVLERKLAESLANKVLINQGGNDLKAAYSWNQGSNLGPDIPVQKLLSSPYVQKYNQVKQHLMAQPSNTPEQQTQSISSNAPTSDTESEQSDKPQPQDIIDYLKTLQNESMNEPEELNLRKDIDSDDKEESSPDDDSDYNAKLAALSKLGR